ncbi:hypothetical protein BOW51_03710 [Solemya velesiana gill symbiont]|uniref:Uncharacterized protein n=1 Tax=Solemya velesiana gill symbiont TaxID=1918948 RepID=A0A1T2KWF1_9GAMM|nr:hypothetical protein BOW51_03710 [Solemya velesiana gill symbiont]
MHAAGSQAQGAEQGGGEGREQDRKRPDDQGVVTAGQLKGPLHQLAPLLLVEGEYAHHVGADTEIGGMPQADHAAVAKNEIEADRGQGIDQDAAEH